MAKPLTDKKKMNKIKGIILGLSCVILTASLIYVAFFAGPKTIEIDEKHFNCTKTDVKGIEATCTQYTAVAWLK